MTTQHVSLWDDPDAQSSDQQASTTTTTSGTETGSETASITTDTTTTSTEQNPIAAAIEASAWEREDIELALSVGKFLLMAYFVYKYREEAGSA